MSGNLAKKEDKLEPEVTLTLKTELGRELAVMLEAELTELALMFGANEEARETFEFGNPEGEEKEAYRFERESESEWISASSP